MARRKRKHPSGGGSERLVATLRAAVKLLDDALGKLAARGARAPRRRG
jgi:hypothetical protein